MKRRIISGSVLLLVLVAIFGVLSMSMAKRTVSADAIRVVEVNVIRQPSEFVTSGGYAATSIVVVSNTTPKSLTVKLLGVEAGIGSWTNVDAGYFTAIPFSIAPHGLAYEYPRFEKLTPRPWRFRLKVCEELKGPERAMLMGQLASRRFISRIQRRPFWSPFVSGTNYFGHETVVVVGEDQDWPKLAGDRSVR
jgi:hypothetical protein